MIYADKGRHKKKMSKIVLDTYITYITFYITNITLVPSVTHREA